jgi:hypothetical protein
MEINSEILQLLVILSEILDKIISFEGWPDKSLLSIEKNSQFNQNPLEFLTAISDQIEMAILLGFNHIRKAS